jgi:hypothetical protein
MLVHGGQRQYLQMRSYLCLRRSSPLIAAHHCKARIHPYFSNDVSKIPKFVSRDCYGHAQIRQQTNCQRTSHRPGAAGGLPTPAATPKELK